MLREYYGEDEGYEHERHNETHSNHSRRYQTGGRAEGHQNGRRALSALPAEGPLNVWGEEFYFKIPGVKIIAKRRRRKSKSATWHSGEPPGSGDFLRSYAHEHGADPVPADRVNVVGRCWVMRRRCDRR